MFCVQAQSRVEGEGHVDWRVTEWVNKRSYMENRRCTERMVYSAHTTKAGKLAETAEFCDYCAFSSSVRGLVIPGDTNQRHTRFTSLHNSQKLWG